MLMLMLDVFSVCVCVRARRVLGKENISIYKAGRSIPCPAGNPGMLAVFLFWGLSQFVLNSKLASGGFDYIIGEVDQELG